MDDIITSPKDSQISQNTDDNYQVDLKRAIKAISVGCGLSILNSILHLIGFAFLLAFSARLGEAGIITALGIGMALLLSWAITYSLLSIVVTNALTAKHSIILSSRNNH